MSDLTNKIKRQQILSAEEMVIQGLKEKGLVEYTPEEKEIIKMADKTVELCNMERRLIKEAALHMEGYRLLCPRTDTEFTRSKVEKWLDEFKELEKNF
jgi:hypothetical protein